LLANFLDFGEAYLVSLPIYFILAQLNHLACHFLIFWQGLPLLLATLFFFCPDLSHKTKSSTPLKGIELSIAGSSEDKTEVAK
jgi:hypothetical protein